MPEDYVMEIEGGEPLLVGVPIAEITGSGGDLFVLNKSELKDVRWAPRMFDVEFWELGLSEPWGRTGRTGSLNFVHADVIEIARDSDMPSESTQIDDLVVEPASGRWRVTDFALGCLVVTVEFVVMRFSIQ